jgi:hypothetical protein
MEFMLHAERKCRKLRMGAVPFSPALVQVVNIIECFKLAIKYEQGKKGHTSRLERLRKKSKVLTREWSLLSIQEL